MPVTFDLHKTFQLIGSSLHLPGQQLIWNWATDFLVRIFYFWNYNWPLTLIVTSFDCHYNLTCKRGLLATLVIQVNTSTILIWRWRSRTLRALPSMLW